MVLGGLSGDNITNIILALIGLVTAITLQRANETRGIARDIAPKIDSIDTAVNFKQANAPTLRSTAEETGAGVARLEAQGRIDRGEEEHE